MFESTPDYVGFEERLSKNARLNSLSRFGEPFKFSNLRVGKAGLPPLFCFSLTGSKSGAKPPF
jgi:hypothetical protein